MKSKFIPTLILFSLSFSQSNDSENDIIEYGFNYTGDFKDGKRHGTGRYIYPNGDTYDGYWVNDIRQGEGTLTYDNDSKTYVGNFVSDLFNGWGALHIIGGEKYEGEWKDGKKHGEGTYYYPLGNTYIGDWVDD